MSFHAKPRTQKKLFKVRLWINHTKGIRLCNGSRLHIFDPLVSHDFSDRIM